MNGKRVLTITRRVIRQLARDRRTIALLFVAPMFVLTLGAILFAQSQPGCQWVWSTWTKESSTPMTGPVNLGQRMVDELAASDTLEVLDLSLEVVEDSLRDGSVQAVIVFPADFSASFAATRQAVLDLRLEGSEPTRSMAITAQVMQAATRALAGLAGVGLGGGGAAGGGEGVQPVTVQASYMFGGEDYDTMDYIAPVYIAVLGMFFVFLLACVAFFANARRGRWNAWRLRRRRGQRSCWGICLGWAFLR